MADVLPMSLMLNWYSVISRLMKANLSILTSPALWNNTRRDKLRDLRHFEFEAKRRKALAI